MRIASAPQIAWTNRTGWRELWALAAVCVALLAVPLHAQSAKSLQQVHRLYVESFGPDKTDGVLRASLIKRLEKTGGYTVIEDQNAVDAVIKGSGEVWVKNYLATNWRSPGNNRQAVYSGYLSVEVIGHDGATLWSYMATPYKLIWTNIADELAGNLVHAMIAAREQSPDPFVSTAAMNLAPATLHGAGATFPAPLYVRWFQSFHLANPGVQLNYDAVGSEMGIQMLQESKADFAGSDAPTAEVRDLKLGTGYWRIPVVLGAVVPIYNIPGLIDDLKFTPEILAGIYLGKITKWNDPEIRRWNKGANLPDADIVVVHRSDGSGTTFTLSDYLSKISSQWKDQLGTGYQLTWPVGRGADGNGGVTTMVEKTPNSIGYVELVYAIRRQLAFGSVRNSSGVFVHANLDSVAEAAKDNPTGAPVPASITNGSRKGAYPIVTYTWLVLPQQVTDPAKRAALLALLQWILSDGQKECAALAYTPLPHEIAEQQAEFVKTLTQPGPWGAAQKSQR
jgi:phosphate transport system substrate-binding protein